MARIGELNRPLVLQARQNSTDAEGRPQENWVTIARTPAKVTPLTSSEFLLAQQAGLKVSHQVEVRARKELLNVPQAGGVQAGHNLRFVELGRVLAIIGLVNVDEGRRFVRLLCSELEPV